MDEIKHLNITGEFNRSKILGLIKPTDELYDILKKYLEKFIKLNKSDINSNIKINQKIVLRPSGFLDEGKITLSDIGLFIED